MQLKITGNLNFEMPSVISVIEDIAHRKALYVIQSPNWGSCEIWHFTAKDLFVVFIANTVTCFYTYSPLFARELVAITEKHKRDVMVIILSIFIYS